MHYNDVIQNRIGERINFLSPMFNIKQKKGVTNNENLYQLYMVC